MSGSMISKRIRENVEELKHYIKEDGLKEASSILDYFLGLADGLEISQRTTEIHTRSYNPLLRQSSYLYGQVQEEIKRRIENGIYKSGQQIPTETALQNEFRVSRPVVRQALMNLKHEDLIYTERGKGTFVRREDQTS